MEHAPWKTVRQLDGWQLTVFSTPGHSLLTDIELENSDAVRYIGTIGTPEMLREIIDKPDEPVPLWVSDLLIIDVLSEDSIMSAIMELLSRGEVETALQRVG